MIGQTEREVKEYLCTFYSILDEMICGMRGARLTDSISHNFIVQMIPHHRGAIEMSKNVLRFTTEKPVVDIAARIIREQTKSIENMRKIQRCCGTYQNSQQELCIYQSRMNQIMETMFSEMKHARVSCRIDCNFMWEMIPHHRGAVKMSKLTLRNDICPELVPILEAIITSQEQGIQEMQELLRNLC